MLKTQSVRVTVREGGTGRDYFIATHFSQAAELTHFSGSHTVEVLRKGQLTHPFHGLQFTNIPPKQLLLNSVEIHITHHETS
ncbi:hypothetical protein MHYP_G00200710 [Metynnis hypsauchen]